MLPHSKVARSQWGNTNKKNIFQFNLKKNNCSAPRDSSKVQESHTSTYPVSSLNKAKFSRYEDTFSRQ